MSRACAWTRLLATRFKSRGSAESQKQSTNIQTLTRRVLTQRFGGPGGLRGSRMSPQMLCPDPRVPKDHQKSNSYAKAKSLYPSPSSDPRAPPTWRGSKEGPGALEVQLFYCSYSGVRSLSAWQASDWLTIISVGLSNLSIGSGTLGVFLLVAC